MSAARCGHGYIFNDRAGDVWASCTCGWEETCSRHGDRRWCEQATASAWDAHCAGRIMSPPWYPAPLTPAETAAAIVATDVAGQVEAAAWDDRYLTADDRRALR